MNRTTREEIIAAKERLNQMAEQARELERRKAAQAHWEKTQAEERTQEAARLVYHQNQAKLLAEKEKGRLQAEAREEEEHLRRHNKTVKQALSQVAKAHRQGKDDEVHDEEENSGVDSSDESDSGSQQEHGPHHHRARLEGEQPDGRDLAYPTDAEGEKQKEKCKHSL